MKKLDQEFVWNGDDIVDLKFSKTLKIPRKVAAMLNISKFEKSIKYESISQNGLVLDVKKSIGTFVSFKKAFEVEVSDDNIGESFL